MPWLLSCNANDSCCYTRHHQNLISQAIDVHEISITRSIVRTLLSYTGILLFLVNCYILLVKEKLCSYSIWRTIVVLMFAKFVQYKPVKKESIVILSGFGLQLETHYWSGRIVRRFVPRGQIVRPILNECVTPFTCYWSLALILRGEDKLMLGFQELRPPLKLLVPIWKALSSSLDGKEGSTS
ncbi:hypothetical protein KSP40_PGU020163 [Platanthera guangdongensis]|uniref:Phosphatidylinositol N-acetylglucosaminyltransferase subunit H conserved domain-containing protein n=1 Tax=Platanthera guangdongensis TaxID=2320717 RepID=A0ABR2N3T7_9ASPA